MGAGSPQPGQGGASGSPAMRQGRAMQAPSRGRTPGANERTSKM